MARATEDAALKDPSSSPDSREAPSVPAGVRQELEEGPPLPAGDV